MKVKPEHYNHMKERMASKLNEIGGRMVYLDHVKAVQDRSKDANKRARWDLAHASGLTGYICQEIYAYADDTHIDTALRAIINEIA